MKIFAALFLYLSCVLPKALGQFANVNRLNVRAQITPEKIWKAMTNFSDTFEFTDSDNPCHEDLRHSFNHFMGERSIFTFSAYTGLSANELGDYRNCLKHNGRYFYYMIIYNVPLMMNGVCLPERCRTHHLTEIREGIAKVLRAAFNVPITIDNINFMDAIEMNHKYTELGTGGIVTYSLVGIMFVFCIIGTVYVMMNESGKTVYWKIAKCFDMSANIKNIIYGENTVDPNLNVLNGVRVLGMLWVIMGHTFEVMADMFAPLVNPLEGLHTILNERFYAIYLGGTLSVDIFFFLTSFLGVLVCDHMLKVSKNSKVATVLMMYFHRVVRIVPVYGLTILSAIYVVIALYNGPVYYVMGMSGQTDYCIKYWHWNLLFINNFVHVNENCMGWSWYLSNDFQMYLLIPLLCILYGYRKIYACLAVLGLAIISALSQVFVIMHYDISMNLIMKNKPEQRSEYYIKPYCRINPFLVGVIFAWMYQSFKNPDKGLPIFRKINRLVTESPIVRYSMYVIGPVIMWCCIFLYYDFYKANENKTVLETILYVIFSRPGFVIGMMLLIYPVMLGKGLILQSIFGNELFGTLSKLTFVAYLFHPFIVAFYYGSMEQSVYFTGSKIVLYGIECFVITYFIAFLVAVIVEYPLTLLSKEFLRPSRGPRGAVKPKAEVKAIKTEKDESESLAKGIQQLLLKKLFFNIHV
eukprot:TRINITY_DN64887_c0_g1_i1.p1 TRINITY_DN64887_c0_g1~~TRINITY_DN64887_c0_g1_i1.p1  ORF type:complete len:694 (+),score=43.94 TRINITY_DN64887_c0_g1_i1:187-2268(+)